jgi:hypothetical protein
VRSSRTPGGCARVARVPALLSIFVADAAEEGRNVIIGMLIVGLIFAAIVVIGEYVHYVRHFKHHRY